MHQFIGSGAIRPERVFPNRSSGYRRFALSDARCGAVHSGWGLCELDAGGHVNRHVQSFEKSIFVLEGNPVLQLGEGAWRLSPGDTAMISVGQEQAWLGSDSGTARWIDMNAPVSEAAHFADETFFDDAPRRIPAVPLSGSGDDAGADQTDAFPVGEGVRITMLVDQQRDAALHNMFLVDYEPGSLVDPHDHPFEEAYFILDGAVEVRADDKQYIMRKGDFLWVSVGCTHAFVNRDATPARWLETQSPLPPASNAYRFTRDWERYRSNDK